MQHLSKKPRPEYLKAQTECARTCSDKAQASHLRHREEFCSFPPGGGRAALNEAALRRRSRGERACWPCADAVAPRLGWGRRSYLRLLQAQSECPQPGQDTRPGSDTVARGHTNHGWEPEAHGNGPEDATQSVEGIEEAAPLPHRAGRDERLSDDWQRSAKTERRW